MSTAVDSRKSVIRYDSVNRARVHFRDMLETAEAGDIATVERRGRVSALVELGHLRWLLSHVIRPHEPQVARQNGKWAIFLPGLPIAVEEDDFDAAVDELVSAIRETPWIGRTICIRR